MRVLNSRTDDRGFDIEVPLADVDTSDFLQIVAALNQTDEEITVTVNGSAGGSATASANGTIGRGGNRFAVGIDRTEVRSSLSQPSMYSASRRPDAAPRVMGETSFVKTA